MSSLGHIIVAYNKWFHICFLLARIVPSRYMAAGTKVTKKVAVKVKSLL